MAHFYFYSYYRSERCTESHAPHVQFEVQAWGDSTHLCNREQEQK